MQPHAIESNAAGAPLAGSAAAPYSGQKTKNLYFEWIHSMVVSHRGREKMNVSFVREFLLWCLVVNYVILLWWVGVFVFAHGWMFKLHRRWFRISEERFDTIHYAAMAIYKIGILLFNLAPYAALSILAGHGG